MTMKRFAVFITAAVLGAVTAFAAAENRVDKVGSAFPSWFNSGIYIGPNSPNPTNDKLNKVTRLLAASATIDFTAQSEGVQDSSAITVTGAQAGDTCTVGTSTTVGALLADFSCYVSAAGQVKVRFQPMSIQEGAATLVSASPSTVVVASITASSRCTATPVGLSAAIAAGGIAVSLTTTNLTLTGPNTVTTVVNYRCSAPIDPASDTYRVYVRSNQ